MLDSIADRHTECKQNDLGDGEEGGSEDDIANGPSVLKGAENKDKLWDDIDDGANEWPENVDDPECKGFGVIESSKSFEGGNGNKEAYAEDDKWCYPDELV